MHDVTLHYLRVFCLLCIIVFYHHDSSICQKWHDDVFLYAFSLSFIIISPPFVERGNHDSLCQKWHDNVFLYAFSLSFIIIGSLLLKEAMMLSIFNY